MAEGIARSLGHDAASAGTHPASAVSPNALKVLESKGISTDGLHPKLVDVEGFAAAVVEPVVVLVGFVLVI